MWIPGVTNRASKHPPIQLTADARGGRGLDVVGINPRQKAIISHSAAAVSLPFLFLGHARHGHEGKRNEKPARPHARTPSIRFALLFPWAALAVFRVVH